jgi:hypothetical protein
MRTLGEYIGAGSAITKGLWHLNGNSTDSSGNGNNGTDTAITYSLANGKFGQGAGFNGSSSKIDYTLAQGVSDYTVSCWFKVTGTNLMTMWSAISGSYEDIIRQYATNGIVFHTNSSYNIDPIRDIGGTCDIPAGVWHNAVLTVKITGATYTASGYVNGLLLQTASSAYTKISWTGNHRLGGLIYENAYWGNGNLDEVIIENVAWSPEKIKKYYTFTKGRFGI